MKPVVVNDMHTLAVINGRGSRLVDTTYSFNEKAIVVTDTRNGFTVKTLPYASWAARRHHARGHVKI